MRESVAGPISAGCPEVMSFSLDSETFKVLRVEGMHIEGAGLSVARPELVGEFALAVEERYGPPPPDEDAAGPSH